MSMADGHEPPQVPHWMHISRCETPAVFILTSCNRDRSSSRKRDRTRSSDIWGIVPPCYNQFNQSLLGVTEVTHSLNESNTPTFILVIFITINSNKNNHIALIIIPSREHNVDRVPQNKNATDRLTRLTMAVHRDEIGRMVSHVGVLVANALSVDRCTLGKFQARAGEEPRLVLVWRKPCGVCRIVPYSYTEFTFVKVSHKFSNSK